MKKEITIIEKASGKFVANYPITLGALNYTPSDEEFHSEAWQCAVEDGIANATDRDKYTFISTDTP